MATPTWLETEPSGAIEWLRYVPVSRARTRVTDHALGSVRYIQASSVQPDRSILLLMALSGC